MFQTSNSTPAGISFSGTSFDRRPQRVPLGTGVYEIVKAACRKTPQNFDEFFAVLKCERHDDPTKVGQVFEFSRTLQGLMVQSSLREIGQLLMFSFGAAAAALPSTEIAEVLNQALLADNWKTFNETQAIQGKSVIGNRLGIRGYDPGWGVNKETGQPNAPRVRKTGPKAGQPYDSPLPKYVFDVAPPKAA